MLISLLLIGCREEISASEPVEAPAGYLELLKAYDDGLMFSSAEHVSQTCVVTFEGGNKITVPETSFIIDDCTEKEPTRYWAAGGWWRKEELILGIKADASLSKEDALPVYVYFDEMTLYMKLSNYDLLVFPSLALEEEEKRKEELAKLQNIPEVRITTDGHAPSWNPAHKHIPQESEIRLKLITFS